MKVEKPDESKVAVAQILSAEETTAGPEPPQEAKADTASAPLQKVDEEEKTLTR